MFTRNIKNRVQLTKSGVRWLVPNLTSHPTEIPDQALTQKLQAVKDDITKTNKDAEYVKIIAETFPNDLKKQLGVVNVNKGAGMVLDGEAIVIRIGLVKKAQESNSRQYQDMIAELEKIIAMSPSVSEKGQAENLKTQLENAKSSYEQGVATTKVVLETQTANLSREKVFSDKNVSWTGLLSMIKKEQGANKTPKDALDNLMKKFDQKGWDASREEEKDATLLSDLEKAGYLRFSGSAGSLEYGHKVVTALREIQKDWSKYEKVINGTEALDAGKFIVPKADDFSNWKNDSQKIANFLADVSGDGILSQTNQVTRMGFLGLFGREDMNKKQLSELGTAKLLQDVIPKDPTDFWNKLGVIAPTTPTQIEGARRALYLRVALADGNPDALRDPSLADRVTNVQIKEQSKQLEANNKARLETVKIALAVNNKDIPPDLLDQAGKSFLTAVDLGGLLIGTGVSLEELARNTKVGKDNPKAFTLLSAGKKWEKQLSQNLQGHLGVGGGAGVDTAGGFFAGAGVDGGIKLIMQDNGKLSVAKGNQTLELNVGVGTSILGFTPVGTVELAYRWNDVISALQSSDMNTRNFLKGLFKSDASGNITMVDINTKTTAIQKLVGDDKYGVQDITMACEYAKKQLESKDLTPIEKVVAVQNFIENFARYNEIRNYQSKQGFQLAGIGFGVLAGLAVLAPFVRLIGQNIQSGYRVDANKTKQVVEIKSNIQFSPDTLANAPEDGKSRELLLKRGAVITENGRGVDVSKAKFADIQVVGDAKKVTLTDSIYSPVSKNERLVTIVQTSRDMNGAETYVLMLTTVSAPRRSENVTSNMSAEISADKPLTEDEKKVLQKLLSVGKLPDTLKGDTKPIRQKYPILERANNLVSYDSVYSYNVDDLKGAVLKISEDKELMRFLNDFIVITKDNISNNPVFLRAFLGTILALTSGSVASNKLGLRIGAEKNPTSLEEVNKYLDTPGLIEAELAALDLEYDTTQMTKAELKELMRFRGGNLTAPVISSTIPKNMYAESAYAKYGQNGTAALPPEARIAGGVEKYSNERIRKDLISKLEVPKNLSDLYFDRRTYRKLLETGTVKITTNGVEKIYSASKSELHFARSAVTSQRTCFNAVFAITVPADLKVEWKEVTVKPVDAKAGGLNISTDTLLTGATSLAEMSGGFAGRNSKDTGPKSGTEGGDLGGKGQPIPVDPKGDN